MKELHVAYKTTFGLFVLCTALSVVSVVFPQWFHSKVKIGNTQVDTYYGLGTVCSSATGTCVAFPSQQDCNEHGEAFCAIWRTSGFAMWLAIMLQAGINFGFINAICYGNRFTRERGWKVICSLIVATVVLQAAATLAMSAVLEHATLFQTGHWRIGKAWAASTASWVLSLLLATSLAIVGLMSAPSQPEYDFFYDSDFETDEESSLASNDDFQKYNRQVQRQFLQSKNFR